MGSSLNLTNAAIESALDGPIPKQHRAISQLRSISGPLGSAVRPVMANPPTITLSVANASSTITNPVNKDSVLGTGLNTNFFSVTGGAAIRAGNTFPNEILTKPASIVSGLTYRVLHDGAKIEFRMLGNGRGCRLIVDGEYADIDPVITPNDGEFYRLVVDFGNRAMRHLEFECLNLFGGVTVGPTDLLIPFPVRAPRAILPGDSFTEGASAFPLDGYASILGRLVGWDAWASGLGGTGYIKTLGDRPAFLARLQADCIQWHPDVVMFMGGINDMDFAASAVGAAAAECFSLIRSSLPDSLLIAGSPWFPHTPIPQSILDIGSAIKVAVEAAGGIYLDTLSQPFCTGSGNAVSPSGEGTADIYVVGTGGDNTHWNAAGHAAAARVVADRLLVVSMDY